MPLKVFSAIIKIWERKKGKERRRKEPVLFAGLFLSGLGLHVLYPAYKRLRRQKEGKKNKRNRPLLLSLDHGSNTITMGASRPTGCTAVSYQSTQRTLALRREIMDEFPGLILFLLLSERGALTALSVSVTPPSLPPTPQPPPDTHTHRSHFPLPVSLLPSIRPPTGCPLPPSSASCFPRADCALRQGEGGWRGRGGVSFIHQSLPANPLPSGPVSPHRSVP